MNSLSTPDYPHKNTQPECSPHSRIISSPDWVRVYNDFAKKTFLFLSTKLQNLYLTLMVISMHSFTLKYSKLLGLVCLLNSFQLYAGQWTPVDINNEWKLDNNCFYLAHMNLHLFGSREDNTETGSHDMWSLASGVSPRALYLSPMRSLVGADSNLLYMSFNELSTIHMELDGRGPMKFTQQLKELLSFCPDQKVEDVDVNNNSDFDSSCVYRLQSWSSDSGGWFFASQASQKEIDLAPYLYRGANKNFTIEVSSNQKNVTKVIEEYGGDNSQKRTPSFTKQCGLDWEPVNEKNFSTTCIYRVKLDNKEGYDMVHSVSSDGTSLYVNPLLPSPAADFLRASYLIINSDDTSIYTMTYDQTEKKTGTVNAIEKLCPDAP